MLKKPIIFFEQLKTIDLEICQLLPRPSSSSLYTVYLPATHYPDAGSQLKTLTIPLPSLMLPDSLTSSN